MASNNVTTDWKTVLATAKAKLNPLVIQINRLEAAVDPLRSNVNTIKGEVAATKLRLDTAIAQNRPIPPYIEILPLKEAAEADPGNAAKQKAWQTAQAKFNTQAAQLKQATAQFEVTYNQQLFALGNAQKELAAALDQIKPLYAQEEQYQLQVDEAERQLKIQSTGTAPGTSNISSATTVPASSNPGNPNIATASVSTKKTVSSNTSITTNSVASGSKTAVPSNTVEAVPATTNKIVKPATKTITTTRTVVTSDGVAETLKTAPVGTQYNKPGSANGKIKAQNLRKVGPDQYVAFASGGAPIKMNAAQAASFFRKQGLTNCNRGPAFMPKKVTKKVTEKKTVLDTKGAPKKKNETPKKEETPPPFDSSDILLAESVQTSFDQANFEAFQDWRVRLSLAPGARYLYNGPNPGILQPLISTNGVVFPYTPSIQVNYQANYNPIDVTHSNYKVFQYTNSGVDSVTIGCDFTAQDAFEARYLLAVIHFFKSMTKMFYGQDQYPIRGTPPPLCYIYGLGGYQFAAQPLAIRDFNYNLPNDVDYIQTTAPTYQTTTVNDGEVSDYLTTLPTFPDVAADRLGETCSVGGKPPPPKFLNVPKDIVTYVPTKISITVGCVPMMSRNQVSNYFSLEQYASGQLVKGTSRQGGGFW